MGSCDRRHKTLGVYGAIIPKQYLCHTTLTTTSIIYHYRSRYHYDTAVGELAIIHYRLYAVQVAIVQQSIELQTTSS